MFLSKHMPRLSRVLYPTRYSLNRPSISRRCVTVPPRRKTTIRTLHEQYFRGEPITMLTAYDCPTARQVDRAGVDIVLVGDSLGMVVLGHATTQCVTLSDIVYHSKAARRGVTNALLMADLPFGSYEDSALQAARSARRLVKEAGVDAVKLEGGVLRAEAVRAIVDAGIACMGHVGLTPQSCSALGGFRAVGRTAAEACRVLDDALAVQDAGAFAVLLECVPLKLAEVISSKLSVPTIGIGAGNRCSGQVLVYHDMLGMNVQPGYSHFMPGFAKTYAKVGEVVHQALQEYITEVRERQFPSEEHAKYAMPHEDFLKFCEYADSHPVCAEPLKESLKSNSRESGDKRDGR